MKKLTYSLLPLGITVGLCLNIAPASAGLIPQNVISNAALSIDGFGSTTNSGFIQANIPTGSTIQRAYLYAASVWSNPVHGVTFHGNTLSLGSATILGPNQNPATTARWDVTSIIASSFTGGLQDFSILENGDNDGAVLVVAYSNPSTQGFTSVILDGELSTGGDTSQFDFASAYTGGDFLVSLASSYSRQPSGQATEIDVTTNSTNNRRLTSSAGGQDDGEGADGGLITVGGIGDSPTNPGPLDDPFDGPRIDDEYYNLALGNSANSAPFISPGDTFLRLKTVNPSNDDNVFGMFITSGFKITATPVPEPSMTLGIFGIGAIGALISRRGKKS
ncbi:Parallel beta-helix repeat [Microcystis aeruginosa PCC 9806]|uniref:PEP-CTERM sorting domain-containing protein n=2 Tax=Microcystis TaxID=1125 RepID=A0A552LY94_9CHRO|nr:PEP-CTERM sorting domain-containing protein [Microcystis aeruginosa]TRV25187.1 MAG: PEP-CTERM sorting domain-containing protein [Microcystis flos-aquae Mf_WU_F_19750830_S460]CCI13651.1 Parallel beta-helix repeat [Microcystis aeruginosa PCC 9806]